MTPESKQPPSVRKNNFTQLWREEFDILYRHALGVPDNGTIVELGLAQGGTSLLFNDATLGRDVGIYSVDIAPSKIALANLEGTPVTVIAGDSAESAKLWKEQGSREIDLLFIDGNHHFEYVCGDYNAWLEHVKPGGKIVFHDYDPPRRGGLAHFGVEICCSTIERMGLLEDISHEYKLLAGTVPPVRKPLEASDCRETFLLLADRVNEAKAKVLSAGDEEALAILRENSLELSSVEACYCLDALLKKNSELLDTESSDQLDFRRWAEQLFGFEHVLEPVFPANARSITEDITFHELSKIITAEQIRLFFLSNILRTLVRWTL